MPNLVSPGRICFAAGTLVQLANAESQAAFLPIEGVRLGGRVHTDAPLEVAASISAQRACHAHSHPDSTVPSTGVVSDLSDGPTSQFDSSQWRVVTLRPLDPEDSDVEVTLLRPLVWLSSHDAVPGSVLYLDLPELNTSGPMRVESIASAPAIQPGPGGLVTGTFRHTAHELAEVRLEGLDEPIRCTPRHPFWSDTRNAWAAACELQSGDTLLSATGAITTVQSIFLEGADERVYNIEVDSEHVYRISSLGVLVHNASSPTLKTTQPLRLTHAYTTHTIGQIRNMRQPAKWHAGEEYIRELYGAAAQRHFPVAGTGGRFVDTPLDLPSGGVLAGEVKTYGQWRTVQGVAQHQEIPVTDRIRQQIVRDVWLRQNVSGFDPRWIFLDAPAPQDLLDLLHRHQIASVTYL